MNRDRLFHDLISHRRQGVGASLARGALWGASKAYAGAVRARNGLFDHRLRPIHNPARPAVSVGNLTVGGTGKTPVVAWLSSTLASQGHRPAVLMRGYGAKPGQKGDEQRLLEQILGAATPVIANPDRVAGARIALEQRPDTSCFVLDDAFQHRRLARVFDLVLIDATRPFGFGHLLPRGLLREPVTGLGRADAVLITRVDGTSPQRLAALEKQINALTAAPVFGCTFELTGDLPAEAVAVSAIGNPLAFETNLERRGVRLVDRLRFGDHHEYTADDVQRIIAAAGKGVPVVTTGKDWVKLEDIWPREGPQVIIPRQRIRFNGEDEQRLLGLVTDAIA